MPAMITHYLFGVDLYHSISSQQIRTLIHHNLGAFRLGLQGPDLFFYHPLCIPLPSSRHIGCRMHEANVQLFFHNYLRLTERLEHNAQQTAYAYLLGMLAHYVLDSSIHPYIYSRTGYVPSDPLSGKNSCGMHLELEASLDRILLHRHRGLRPSQFHASKTIHLTKHEFSVLTYVLSKALKASFGDHHYPCSGRVGISTAILSMKAASSLLHSKKGRRRQLMYHLEHRILGQPIVTHAISWDGLTDRYDAFNAAHTIWHNPWLRDHSSILDVNDLYQLAKQRYLAILPFFADYINADRTLKPKKRMPLLKEIGDVSYHSGIPCV